MFSLDDALARRDEAKTRYLKDFLKLDVPREHHAFRAFGLANAASYLPPDRRLGIGVAFGAQDAPPGLALRVLKTDGPAHRAAKVFAEAAERDGAWVDLRVVKSLSVPSREKPAALPAKAGAGETFPVSGRPLCLGASVAHSGAPAGSLGGFVRIGEREGIIGACHVLANSGRNAHGDGEENPSIIYHPASADSPAPLTSANRVARLAAFSALDTASVEVDAAVAVLLPGMTHTGNVVPDVATAKKVGARIGAPPAARETIASFRTVAKVGRTTHYTEGRLSAGFFDQVGLDVPGRGIVYYSRLFEVERQGNKDFAAPGDSGAVVFDTQTLAAFALVVGGGEWDDDGVWRSLTYCCSLERSLGALGARWL